MSYLSFQQQVELQHFGFWRMPQVAFLCPAHTSVTFEAKPSPSYIMYLTGFGFADSIPAYDFVNDAGIKFSYNIDNLFKESTYVTADLIAKKIDYGWIPIKDFLRVTVENTSDSVIAYCQTAYFFYAYRDLAEAVEKIVFRKI